MIDGHEKLDALRKCEADVARSAFRLAYVLAGETASGYQRHLADVLATAFVDAVNTAHLPSRFQFEEQAIQDEGFDTAKLRADLAAGGKLTAGAEILAQRRAA
jgi:hypothetical protein